MNPFLFTQITYTVLGILIFGEIVALINKKMKLAGIISMIMAVDILIIGIISPISVVICTIAALILGGLGAFVVHKDKQKKRNIGKLKPPIYANAP